MRLLLLTCLALLALGAAGGSASRAARPATWEPDTRVVQETGGAPQHETSIAVNPLNADNAVVVYKDYRAGVFNYLDATTDGGATWHEQRFPTPNPDPGIADNTDPTVYFRRDGRAYLIWTGEINWPNAGLYTSWSDDGGLTWSPPVMITVPQGHYDDRALLTFDTTGGPRDGTMYLAWCRFGNGEMMGAHSTDGGATWSAAVLVSQAPWDQDDDNPQLLVEPDGTLTVVFLNNLSPGQPGTLVLTRSTDGGATFSPGRPIFTEQQPPYHLPGGNWRLYTYHFLARDPVRGWLTIVWPDYTDGAANGVDILMRRSTDDGATWSAPIRLNDDPPGLVRDQWFPTLVAAPDGRLTALWLDRRDDPANVRYYAYARSSLDGGLTWTPGEPVSSASSDPNVGIPAGSDDMGDYIGLAAGPGVVWGSWTDTRNGDEDIYAARLRFTPAPTPTITPTPSPGTPTATSIPPTSPTATPAAPPSPTAPAPATGTPSPVGPTPTPTATATPSRPPTATATPSPAGASPTPCAPAFTDVPPDAYFAVPVAALACRGVLSGYADGTFRPYAPATRGQLVKIVVGATGRPLVTPAAPTFADVPPAQPFYLYIETAAAAQIVSGYNCGAPGEPCDAGRHPYFRPGAGVSRGQLAKIMVAAAGWALAQPPGPTFADVPPGSTFFPFVETAAAHGLVSGYACGGEGEPCDRQNRPYFRPGAGATRGQIAKIVYFANCCSAPAGRASSGSRRSTLKVAY